jgi:hypothetical protein
MSAPASPNWKWALEFIWGQYRIWSATSRAYQSQLSAWRRRVLYFGIAGAVIGTLASQPSLLGDRGSYVLVASLNLTVATALAYLSALLLALATYFTTKILTPANEGGWLRARSVAEAYKREAYLLLAQAPPYDGAITPASLEEVRKISKGVEDLDEEPLAEDEKKRGMPAALLTVDEYLGGRVREQIGWYRGRAAEHRAVARRIKNVSLWLGLVAVVFGVIGAQWTPLVAFVAVITTVTTSLASYLYAGRYQYLVVSYLATARKLEELILEWDLSGKTDAERKQFVLDCENTFASENSAWMAEMSKPKPQEPAAPTAPPTSSGSSASSASSTSSGSSAPPPPVNPQGNGAGGANGDGVVGGGGEVEGAGEGELAEEGVGAGGGTEGEGGTAGEPGDGT